ncbi:TetR/AcrR family transcriptional regulator [bacterium]|nr:TetR/AcrR family transcriptional regulator [bacterium]
MKLTRDEALHRIADVFRRVGYEGASLSELSRATGLGRASLYHHFPGGKEEMAREVFRWLGEVIASEFVAPLAASGRPRARLERWVEGVARIYAGGSKSCLLGAMVLGGGSEIFARELAEAFRAQLRALERLLVEAGANPAEARRRAENALGRIQGALVLGRGLQLPRHFRRVLAELPDELLARIQRPRE